MERWSPFERQETRTVARILSLRSKTQVGNRKSGTRSEGPEDNSLSSLPFGREEMVRILAAADQFKEEMPSHGIENGRRIRGLVLLLRYSGMRIGDAVNFSTDRLEGNRLFLYTQKTGVPVNTILPGFVLSALEATPRVTEKFFFWSGRGKLESIVRSWQTRLRKLFKLANVPNGHAHRFRDTFAVELLLAGVQQRTCRGSGAHVHSERLRV